MLAANRTYYVSTGGSNSNNGLTSGTPFLTLQYAYDRACADLDFAGFTVTILGVAGSNAFTAGIAFDKTWTGGGTIVVDGGAGATMIMSGSAFVNSVVLPGLVTFNNFTFSSAGNLNCINNSGTGTMIAGTGLVFGNVGSGGQHFCTNAVTSVINAPNDYTISGDFGMHAYAATGLVNLVGVGKTTTISANVTMGYAFTYASGGVIYSFARAYSTGAFTATGQRYIATDGGRIITGGTLALFPGTTTGSLLNGGSYNGYSALNQRTVSAALTVAFTDTLLIHPSADTTARTWTIDSNANVPLVVGTMLTFINQNGAGVLTIAITSDTMRLAGAGTTGSRTLAANGVATAVKITATEWQISGTGLT